ncbi:MAG: hypothetical protein KDC49_10740 [Saprospiraceae bacterium]|nr:hypothetical protein [Saprospiraceae bacterium]
MKLVCTMIAAVFFMSTAIAQNVGIGTTTPANKLSVVGKMDISDSLGIGITYPSERLEVSGTTKTTNLQITGAPSNGFILVSDATGFARWANSATIESDPKVGTLTTNKTPRWNGLTLADGLVFDNGTNVGIGTITPAQKLDVAGTTKTTNLQITSGASNGFILKSDPSGIASWANINSIETDPKVGPLTSNKIPKWNGTTLADGLLFDNGTNIGIGTITPSQKLDVSGTTKTTNLQITNGAGTGYILKSDASGNASWATETDPKVGTLTSNKIPKWNGNNLADGLVFDNGTNVGIGTVTPAQKLEVAGTTKTTNLQITSGAADGFILISDADGIASWANPNINESDPKVGTLTSNKIPKWNGTSLADGLVFDDGTNVGIGTTTPAGELHVRSAASSNSIIDQQQTTVTGGTAGTINWQSFTAGATGLLTRVDLQVSSPIFNGTSPGTIRIFMGEGNTGTVLSSTAVTFQPVFNTFQSFTLSSFPAVIAGNIYTIEFRVPTQNIAWINLSSNNPYAGGRTDGNIVWDYLFKTYVSSEVVDGLVVADGKAKVAKLQITNGATNGFVLKSDVSGNASWVDASSVETDPKVGTLNNNRIPKWSGTTLTNGLIFDTGSNIGIGTATPTRKLTVVNPSSVGIAQLSGNPSAHTSIGIGRTDIEGTLNVAANTNEFATGAEAGDIVLRTESNAQRVILNSGNGNAALTVLNGNTGIGTTTPTQKLDVSGTTKTTNLQITNGASNGYLLKSDANGNASWVNLNSVETDPKVGTLTSNKIPKWNGTNLADGLLFDNGTNIGIGTLTPAQKLDVAGTTRTSNLQITNGATNGFVLKSDAIGNASWVNANTLTITETDPKVGTLTSNKIPKWNGTTLADGLIFDNGTNVGIGTTTPDNKLSVIGNSDITGNLGIGTSTPANKLSVIGNSDITGTLGIGTTAPEAKLHVASSNTGLRIDVPPTQTAFSIGGAGSVKVDAIGVEGGRLLINDNGNMGIGNNNPITTLDVNGGIRTKYSGSTVVDVVGGLVTTLNITIPAVPADWNVDNTIVIVTNADGVDGIVRQAKLSSLTNIAVKYIQDINGLARLNWIILRQ